jgi:hypothetical protein
MRYYLQNKHTYGIRGLGNDTEWSMINSTVDVGYLCYYFYLNCNQRKMENYTLGTKVITPTEGVNIYLPKTDDRLNYTELGIFISGIILSVGGFLALLLTNIRKSNCSQINCGCFSCSRENLDID